MLKAAKRPALIEELGLGIKEYGYGYIHPVETCG
jgi:hypothetical protein